MSTSSSDTIIDVSIMFAHRPVTGEELAGLVQAAIPRSGAVTDMYSSLSADNTEITLGQISGYPHEHLCLQTVGSSSTKFNLSDVYPAVEVVSCRWEGIPSIVGSTSSEADVANAVMNFVVALTAVYREAVRSGRFPQFSRERP